jgi:hypothetical protein
MQSNIFIWRRDCCMWGGTLQSHAFTFSIVAQYCLESTVCMGPHRCQIIGYSGLSDSIYTDLKFLQVIFCYCSNTRAAQLIRGVFHLDISFIFWFRVFCVFWSLHSWKGSLSMRQGVRRHHNGWCTDVKHHTSHSLRMLYIKCKYGWNWSIRKGTSLGDQNSFLSVSRLPVQWCTWKITPCTHCACIIYSVNMVEIVQ